MLIFAVLQWNDPDRVIWIAIYLATALLALITYIEVCKPCIQACAIILGIACLIMLMQAVPGAITYLQTSNYAEIFSPMIENKPYIEQVREFLGLLIVLVYCILVVKIFHRN